MTRKNQQDPLGSLVLRAQAGDELAFSRLYNLLHQRFFPWALRFFKGDEDKAWTAFHEAITKLHKKLRNGFEWQGELQFYKYFKKDLQDRCLDIWRGEKKKRERLPIVALDDEALALHYGDWAAGWDPDEEEKEERRKERIREAVQEHLAKASAQERRLWEGYRALTALPGGDKWPLHRKTAFLKAYLKVSKTAFYPAHSRFKGGMEDLAKSLGLLR